MIRKIKIDTIFQTSDPREPVRVTQEILDKIQVGDIILSGIDEGHYSENSSWDPHWEFSIRRERHENDEEFQKRKDRVKQQSEWNRKRRYESYLKLKEEFGEEKM